MENGVAELWILALAQTPVLSRRSSVALGKLLYLSVPQFPVFRAGVFIAPSSLGW